MEPPDTPLARAISGNVFSNVSLLLIMANTLFIGWESDQGMKCALRGEDVPAYIELVNRGFLLAFSLELIFRVVALRSWWALAPDSHWNFFDAFLVSTSLIQQGFSGINVSFMRVFRIFRIVRVARIFRAARFLRELRRMVLAIASCFKSLIWAFLMLIMIMYVFSIFLVQGATGFISANPNSALIESLQYWFASLPITMFSLLLAVSGGRDWWDMLEPLVDISEIYRVVFTLYVVFVTFGVLNVLTGVFMQNANEFQDKDLVIQAQRMHSENFIREMQAFFKTFDPHNEGQVTWERFEQCMEEEDILAFLASNQLDCQDAFTLFELLDSDGQDQVDVMEFIQGCLRLQGSARSIEAACMMRDIHSIGQCLKDLAEEVSCAMTAAPTQRSV